MINRAFQHGLVCGLLLAVSAASWPVYAQPVEAAALSDTISEVRVLDSDTLVCTTGHGWYRGDLRTNHWRLFLEIKYGADATPNRRLVGAGLSNVFFVETRDGHKPQLIRYEDGYTKRIDLVEGISHASFVDDRFGVIGDEQHGIRLTRDAGQSWVELAHQPNFPITRSAKLTAIDEDAVVVIQAGGTGHVWCQPLGAGAQLPDAWSVRLPVAPNRVIGLKDGCVWLLGSDLMGLDLKDGTLRYRREMDHRINKVIVHDDWIFVLYPKRVEALKLVERDFELAFVNDFPADFHEASQYIDHAGASHLVMASEGGRLATLGPLGEGADPDFSWLRFTIENGPAVEEKARRAAMEELAKKSRRMIELSRQIPREVHDQILEQAKLLNLEGEEGIDWLISEYEKYLEANPLGDE